MSLKSPKISYDKCISDKKFNINDFKKFNEEYRKTNINNLNEKILGSIPFYDDNKTYIKVLVYF